MKTSFRVSFAALAALFVVQSSFAVGNLQHYDYSFTIVAITFEGDRAILEAKGTPGKLGFPNADAITISTQPGGAEFTKPILNDTHGIDESNPYQVRQQNYSYQVVLPFPNFEKLSWENCFKAAQIAMSTPGRGLHIYGLGGRDENSPNQFLFRKISACQVR